MPKEFRRGTLLIDRAFQLRFSWYVCSWILALGLINPAIANTLFELVLKYAESVPGNPGIATLQSMRGNVILLLVLLQLLFAGAVFVTSLFLSHRIAGPIHKLKLFIRAAKEGAIDRDLTFREKDHFKEVATEYNSMMESIRDMFSRNSELAASVADSIERALSQAGPETRPDTRKELEEAVAKLRKIREPWSS